MATRTLAKGRSHDVSMTFCGLSREKSKSRFIRFHFLPLSEEGGVTIICSIATIIVFLRFLRVLHRLRSLKMQYLPIFPNFFLIMVTI